MTHSRLSARLILLSGLATLGACAATSSTRYPSLLPRAIESRSDAEPEVEVAVAEPDPALDAKIATISKALDANAKDFAIAATRADSTARVAKGDKVGGERWIEAQTALAELDVYRAQSSGVVTDFEELAIARAADGKPAYPALEAAVKAAQTELDSETARIATLQAMLPSA